MEATDWVPDQTERIRRLEWLTVAWMTIEASVALTAAWRANSVALIAFGGDSAIELISAVVVLRRFSSASPTSEQRAARMTGMLLFVLAGWVAIEAGLSLLGLIEPEPSYLGIFILVVAALGMPWLAREKRVLSSATRSSALRADAAESALCGYLSLIALAGIGINSIWHIRWADPAAALAILPLVVKEGVEAMRGKVCCHERPISGAITRRDGGAHR